MTAGVEGDQPPLPLATAVRAVAACALATGRLLWRRQLHQPTDHVGDLVSFADGSSATVYRETCLPHELGGRPVALVVEFRLRWVRGRGHALFRAESLLNTPLFVGFPGFASKLWLAHDQHGVYRGIYDWDGAAPAHAYARALWWILALVSERGSIHYVVLPSCTRADLLAGGGPPSDDAAWWRVTTVDRRGELDA